MINWLVRFKNINFWLAIIPALALLAQSIAALFGFTTINLDDLSGKLIAVVDSAFVVLSILGIVNDPTTAGVADSKQALTYTKPKQKGR